MTTPSKPVAFGRPDPNSDEIARESVAVGDATPCGDAATPQVERGTPPVSAPKRRGRRAVLASAFAATCLGGVLAIRGAGKGVPVADAEVLGTDYATGSAVRDRYRRVTSQPAATHVSPELAEIVCKLLNQGCHVKVTPIGGPVAIRTVERVHELKPDDRLCHIGVYGDERVAALDVPATLAVLRELPELIAGRAVNGFDVTGGTLTAEHLRTVRATPPERTSVTRLGSM